MATPHVPHPHLHDAPLPARRAYALLAARMALADGHASAGEQRMLDGVLRRLGLNPHDTAALAAEAVHLDAAGVDAALIEIAGTELRYTLLADVIGLAWGDGAYDRAERAQVAELAAKLDVPAGHLDALEAAVLAYQAHAAPTPAPRSPAPPATPDRAAASLTDAASVGVPLGAILALPRRHPWLTGTIAASALAVGAGLPALGLLLAAGAGGGAGARWLVDAAESDPG